MTVGKNMNGSGARGSRKVSRSSALGREKGRGESA